MNEGYNYIGKRYVAMARASDTKDGTTSTQAQLALLHERGTALQMTCIGEIVLDGVSGSRPGQRQDMADVLERKRSKNDFDVLLVQRLDRLTRGGSNHGFWFEHECAKVGIQLLAVGDDIPEGRYASLIKVAKYEAAKEQAFSISQRSTQGYQLALEEGRVSASSRTPYGCWRLYLTSEKKPLHIIRDLRDGRQQKLDAETHVVVDTLGQVGGEAKGHYRKQKQEKVLITPGDAAEIAVVRQIFELHFRQGWGGKRIADVLNRQGTPSPCGRNWSQRQVEVLYNNEIYTGINVCNRTTSALYHQRQHAEPKASGLAPSVLATAKTIPVQIRPLTEWFIAAEPLMRDFLGDEQLRAMAVAGQDRYWKHLADPDRPKLSKSKHKTSDYLLSGLLTAKQDGGVLIGVLCGRVSKKTRYYRHRRGRTGYLKGSIFNKLIHAETIEKTVLDVLKQTLLDAADLRPKLLTLVAEQSRSAATLDIKGLAEQRERLQKRTQFLVANLDEDTLADVQPELEKLKAQRRQLDEQIATAANAAPLIVEAPEAVAERVIKRLGELSAAVDIMPSHLLREWIHALVPQISVDMETKAIEISVALPSEMLKTAFSAEKPMRLVSSSGSSSGYETHPPTEAEMLIAMIDCQFRKASNHICYGCRRRTAA